VAAVSNLASAAGDWQSVSSRGRPHKSAAELEVEGRVSRRVVVWSALCCACGENKEMILKGTLVAAMELLHKATVSSR